MAKQPENHKAPEAKPAVVQQPPATAALTADQAAADAAERQRKAREDADRDERERAEQQKEQERERAEQIEKARNGLSDAEKIAQAGIGDQTKPYGTDNPAPGAAGYEPPKLNPEPGSIEYQLAHPGDITNGTITRDNVGDLKSHDEVRKEKDEKAA